MKRIRHTEEQIIVKLREVEVLCGQGKTLDVALRHIAVEKATYYCWRKKYGGLQTSDAKRLREL